MYKGDISNSMPKRVLVVDELDRSIHPELMERLVLLFHNHTMNKQHSQLIFTSHNTNLLDAKVLRRDQIVFVEKDEVVFNFEEEIVMEELKIKTPTEFAKEIEELKDIVFDFFCIIEDNLSIVVSSLTTGKGFSITSLTFLFFTS